MSDAVTAGHQCSGKGGQRVRYEQHSGQKTSSTLWRSQVRTRGFKIQGRASHSVEKSGENSRVSGKEGRSFTLTQSVGNSRTGPVTKPTGRSCRGSICQNLDTKQSPCRRSLLFIYTHHALSFRAHVSLCAFSLSCVYLSPYILPSCIVTPFHILPLLILTKDKSVSFLVLWTSSTVALTQVYKDLA